VAEQFVAPAFALAATSAVVPVGGVRLDHDAAGNGISPRTQQREWIARREPEVSSRVDAHVAAVAHNVSQLIIDAALLRAYVPNENRRRNGRHVAPMSRCLRLHVDDRESRSFHPGAFSGELYMTYPSSWPSASVASDETRSGPPDHDLQDTLGHPKSGRDTMPWPRPARAFVHRAAADGALLDRDEPHGARSWGRGSEMRIVYAFVADSARATRLRRTRSGRRSSSPTP